MNAQQISLNLVAQLDQGNIQSQASQMAMNMSRAIEEAFQGIGAQIAAQILTGVRQGLQGSIEMVGQARFGGGAGFLPVSETERQVMAQRATTTRGLFTPEGEFRPIGETAPAAQPQPGVVPPTAPPPPTVQAPAAGPQPAAGPPPTEETEGGFLQMLRSPRGKNMLKGVGAIGAGIEFIGELPGLFRSSAASGAEIENLQARAAMRGDVEQMMAIQRLGGQDAVRGRAQFEEGAKITGEGVGAAVAAAMSIALAPVSGGLSLLLGGAALGVGMDTMRRAAGFNTQVEQNIQGQTEAERKQFAEIYNFLQRGRETAVRGFEAARQAGAPELSGIMMGGMDANLARNALSQARDNLSRLESSGAAISPNEMERQRTQQEIERSRQRVAELERQAAAGEPFQVTSQGRNVSLRQFAAQFGIGEQQFLQTMQQTAGMGGVFLGQQPRLEQMPNQIADLVRLQGLGLPNAAQAATQLFQGGGMTRGESIEAVRQMFEDAVSAGMDKTQLAGAISEVAQRSQQLGFGGGAAAATEFQRGLGLAQAAFGAAGTVEGPEMRMAQAVSGRLQQAGLSRQADLGKIGGQEGVDRFLRQFGNIRAGRFERMELQETQYDQPTLERRLRELGASDEEIQQAEARGDLATQLQAEKQQGILRATERGLGSREAAFQFLRRQTPEAGTGAGVEALRQLYEPLRQGRGTQPQIYDFNEQTGEFFKKAEAPSGLTEQLGVDFDPKTGQFIQKTREVPAIEAGAMQAPGAAPARALAQLDATQISAGLNDLNTILPVLNSSLAKLVDRANAVLSGNTGAAAAAGAPAAPGTPTSMLSAEQMNALLSVGGSSSMASRAVNSSFMPGRSPSS